MSNLLTLYGLDAALVSGAGVEVGQVSAHFRAATERGEDGVDKAMGDVIEGRVQAYIRVTIYHLNPVVMIDSDFDPVPGTIVRGLEWRPVADYVICTLPIIIGQAPTDEAEYKEVILELLEELIATSFPAANLQVAKNHHSHYHPDIYVSRRDDL